MHQQYTEMIGAILGHRSKVRVKVIVSTHFLEFRFHDNEFATDVLDWATKRFDNR